MAKLTAKDVRHIAKLARLRVTDAEVETLARELSSILDYVALLNELNTENVTPTAQVTDLMNVFREDEVRPSEATTEELLACSPLPIVDDQIETLSAHGK